MRILTLILWYFFLKIMWGKFKKQMENLEEYNGEFIFTFLVNCLMILKRE